MFNFIYIQRRGKSVTWQVCDVASLFLTLTYKVDTKKMSQRQARWKYLTTQPILFYVPFV